MTTKIPVELSSTPSIVDNGDATAITIDSSENVGIGVTTPFSQTQITETGWSSGAPYGTVLTVTGNNTNDANWGHLLITDSSTGTGNGGMLRFAVGSTSSDISPHSGIDGFTEGSNYGGLKFLTRPNGGTSTERMRIDSNGKVGIGNTSPSNALTVGSTSVTDSIISVVASSSGFPQIRFSDDASESGQGRVFYDSANDALGFSTAQTERMRIDSSGNVLIGGTSSNINSLDGLMLRKSGSRGQIFCSGDASTIDETYFVYDNTNSEYEFFVSYHGTVYYRTLSQLSDERKKDNIADITLGLDAIKELRPVSFDWKNNKGNNQLGFIAQEVESTSLKQLVGTYKDENIEDCKSLNKDGMIPVLVKAIQEQQELIETLTTRIETLEGGE